MVRTFAYWLLFFSGVYTFNIQAQAAALRIEVADIFGPATLSVGGKPPQALKAGSIVPPGAVIRTGRRAAVDINLGRKLGVIRLTQNTVLTLPKLELANPADPTSIDVQINLSQGTILGRVAELPAAGKLEVKVRNGVASVREGEYRIDSEGYLVQMRGLTFFAFVPGDEPTLQTLKAPPAVYFSPIEGVKVAPPPLVREVQNQLKARLRGL